MSRLAQQKFAQFLPLNQLADHHDHPLFADGNDFLMMILHQDRAMSQGIEFSSICDRCLAGWVAEWIVKLRRPLDAGASLDDDINLALPATSERAINGVFPGDRSAGLKIEPL